MRVFVTGATGFIGKAVVSELLGAGHKVLGLARTDAGAAALTALGADVQRGSLEDAESLREGAAASDGVIHLAFIHDFTDYEANCRTDREAIETMGTVFAGSDRPLIITSGTLMLPRGHLGTEDDAHSTAPGLAAARGQSETLAKSLASKGVRSAVMRLPPTNHGDGDHGFIARLISIAREKGVSAYVGDGRNRWPAVHRLDTARAYLLALEKAPAGATLHAVAEEGVALKDIAETIGEQLKVPVESKTPAEAQEHFGWLAFPVAADNPVSSKKTQEQLGWKPEQRSLIADLKEGTYFKM